MIELVDDLGTTILLEGPAQRIVCLVPSLTETLFAFGAGPRIVGVTEYCIHPREGVEGKPRIGGTKNIAVARILALNPDIVLANAEENRKHQIEALRKAGLKVFVTYPRSVDQCMRTMNDLAALTGTEESAAACLSEIDQARAEARSRRFGNAPAVFCPIWKNPYMTINNDTFVNSMILEAGGRNIFADSGDRYPQVSLEEAAQRMPDIIILPTEPYHFVEADIADFKVLGDDLPAVKRGRIHIVEGELLSWYGPRVPRALRELIALFHPSALEVQDADGRQARGG